MAKAKVHKPTHEEFVFRVQSPSTSYGFSTQIMRHERDAFWEHQTITSWPNVSIRTASSVERRWSGSPAIETRWT